MDTALKVTSPLFQIAATITSQGASLTYSGRMRSIAGYPVSTWQSCLVLLALQDYLLFNLGLGGSNDPKTVQNVDGHRRTFALFVM
jgi:hypothetical protein